MDEYPDSANGSDEAAGGVTWIERHFFASQLLAMGSAVALAVACLRFIGSGAATLLIAIPACALGLGIGRYALKTDRYPQRMWAGMVAVVLVASSVIVLGFQGVRWLESGRAPISLSTAGGVIFILMGCGAIWVGIVLPRFGSVMSQDANGQAQIRRWTRPEVWLCRAGLVDGGVAFICLGVLVPRYSRGTHLAIPVHVPLLDQLISIALLVGMIGFLPLMLAWGIVFGHAEEKWRVEHQVGPDPQGDTDSGQPIAPPS